MYRHFLYMVVCFSHCKESTVPFSLFTLLVYLVPKSFSSYSVILILLERVPLEPLFLLTVIDLIMLVCDFSLLLTTNVLQPFVCLSVRMCLYEHSQFQKHLTHLCFCHSLSFYAFCKELIL